MDSGLFELEAALSDVAATVRTCAEGFMQLADDRGITLHVSAPPHLPAFVDRDKLASALTNLLSNAIAQASPGGWVRCSLRTRPGTLVIDVADDGPGVAPSERGAIFRRFHTRGTGGTGLGLALVREIATLHGGTVTVGDAPEGGALFQLTLPLRARRAGAPASTDEDLRPELAR
jgi:signal transduction histidine kinase